MPVPAREISAFSQSSSPLRHYTKAQRNKVPACVNLTHHISSGTYRLPSRGPLGCRLRLHVSSTANFPGIHGPSSGTFRVPIKGSGTTIHTFTPHTHLRGPIGYPWRGCTYQEEEETGPISDDAPVNARLRSPTRRGRSRIHCAAQQGDLDLPRK